MNVPILCVGGPCDGRRVMVERPSPIIRLPNVRLFAAGFPDVEALPQDADEDIATYRLFAMHEDVNGMKFDCYVYVPADYTGPVFPLLCQGYRQEQPAQGPA